MDTHSFPCSRCHATDQQVAAVRYGVQHGRSLFRYLCLDTAGCDARHAALETPPLLTSDDRRTANRARWDAQRETLAANR